MKHLTFILTLVFLTFAGKVSAEVGDVKPDDSDVSAPDRNASAMIGTYVGPFGPRKITIGLDRVIGKTVSGYSIVSGNERAFSGSWEVTDAGIKIIAKEPGDHADDGIFTILFTANPKSISGEWIANDKKKASRKFNLPARVFKYNAKAGQHPQSSIKALKESDVENMKSAELRIMRNEIYARHGYSFKLADMRAHFESFDWYMPMAVDITDKLTATEKKNADLIKRYENYSAEYYDSFGR